MSGEDRSVVGSVTWELAEIGRIDKRLASSGLASSALALAAMIDDTDNSATSRSMCARELRETLRELHALAPADAREDGIDELNARRSARLATA